MHHAAVSSAIVLLKRKTPSGPMKSCPNTAPHPGREAAVFNESLTSIKQTGSQPHQVKGVRDPGVTHPVNMPTHHATVPRVDTVHPADAALTAGAAAVVPHLNMTGLITATARSHKSRAAVDYTPIGVEPHEPTRGVWPIATVANDSQLHLVASSI